MCGCASPASGIADVRAKGEPVKDAPAKMKRRRPKRSN